MVITYVDDRGLVLTAPDVAQARREAERWLLEEGMPPLQVAQLDVPRAPASGAWWSGEQLLSAEEPGAQAVIVVDVPRPAPA
ncbi:hypothetical protein DQ384_38255 [Sphaerisporangium album]|uniref:Uncharacterized protein n=1 Tax=Sphaerisporangium album TaxID=509200 RepID=A0A367ENF5_9ACTN|nr:hypothetical protein [Sphaerisporangium album]RCG19125.1 hypothetical protein DQ384_38255 [Sphaerisporangium album]